MMEMILENSAKECDCKFIIKDDRRTKIFPGHKIIFSFASEVFERMFFGGNYIEALTGDVIIVDIKPNVFEKFRAYVYSYDKSKLEEYQTETLRDLMIVGTKYLIKSLITDCVETLRNRSDNLEIIDLLKLLECGHLIGNGHLIATVANNLKNKFIEPATLTNDGIYNFSPKVFYQYVSLITGRIEEPIRFRLIESYLKKIGHDNVVIDSDKMDPNYRIVNIEQLPYDEPLKDEQLVSFWNNYVQNLMALIEFKKFKPSEFYEGPGKSKLFTMKLKYEWLYVICQKCRNNHH